LNFGPSAEYVRFFTPLVLGEKVIREQMRSFATAAKNSQTLDEVPEAYLEGPDFDLGYWEHVCATGCNMDFNFVF
jgi:hypothetical protein